MIGIERRFSDDTRLIDLTVGDLKELITSLISKIKQIEKKMICIWFTGISRFITLHKATCFKNKIIGNTR